jgi:hypothetical protein
VAVRHFRHKLEARHFTIVTDLKPLTFASHQKKVKYSTRQFNHLDFIAQFTTDIRHIAPDPLAAAAQDRHDTAVY